MLFYDYHIYARKCLFLLSLLIKVPSLASSLELKIFVLILAFRLDTLF